MMPVILFQAMGINCHLIRMIGMMMEIEVRLFATLQDLVPKKSHSHFFSMEIERGSTAGAVLYKLKIPEEMAKIILVNGRYSSEDTVLEEGDVLGVFPPLGGG